MRFAPRPLSAAEMEVLARCTDQLLATGVYADWVAAVARSWSPRRVGTARQAAFDARPRGDRCVYCQDNEGRELDHLRPKTLHPLLAYCWSNLIPACSTCGGAAFKGALDAVLDPAQPKGWREISRQRGAGAAGPLAAPPNGVTAWWNPRLADPLRAMRLDIVGGSFLFDVTAAPGTADFARMSWTLEVLGLNRRSSLVRQRSSAFLSYMGWLRDVVACQQAGDSAAVARLRADLPNRSQPVVWAEMKRQRGAIPEVDVLIGQVPAVIGW